MALDYPAHPSPDARDAVGYARPHDLEVTRADTGDGLWATLRDVRISGALVKLELDGDESNVIQVELGREQYDGLRLRSGERVYVRLRRIRVFSDN
jgi:sulfate transport system ATP-binding protein